MKGLWFGVLFGFVASYIRFASIYIAGFSCSDFHLWYGSFEVTAARYVSSKRYSKCWGFFIAAMKGKAIEISIQNRIFNLIEKKIKEYKIQRVDTMN